MNDNLLNTDISFYQKRTSIPIYCICLFFLCFSYGLSSIYIFANNGIVYELNIVIQILTYPILIALIVNAKYSLKQFWLIGIVGLIFIIEFYCNHSTNWLRYYLLFLASRKVKFVDIVRTLLISFVSILVLGVTLYFIGISNSGVGRRGAIACGFVQPNILSMVVITIVFLIVTLQGSIKKSSIVLIITTIVFIGIVSKTQTAIIVLLLLPCIYSWVKRGVNKNRKLVKLFIVGSQVMVLIASCLLIYFYPKPFFTPFRDKIDMLFTYRPYLNYNNFTRYGFTLFGQKANFTNTSEYAYNYFTGMLSNQRYNTVDNAYVTQIIAIGVVTIIPVYVFYIKMMKKAMNNKKYMVITIAILCSCYAFLENNYNEAYYFFPFFYLMSMDSNNFKNKS